MVPAPRRLFVVRCIRTSGITPSYLRFRSRQGALCICERCDYVGVLLRPHTPSSMDTWIRTPRGSCLVSMRCGHGCHVASAGARVCARAPAPSVTRIKLCSSRSRRDMTPAQRRLQKNGHNVGAIGACAMTWSGMPLSRGSGHFCTRGEGRAASTVVRMMLADAGFTNNIIMCVLGAWVTTRTSMPIHVAHRSGHFAPAVCYGRQISAWGCCETVGTCDRPPAEFSNCASSAALWGSSCKLPKSAFAALSGRLEMPCECASRPHIHARVCTWHAIVQMEVRMCYRRPRWLYASRCPELKRAVRSPGRCSRAAKAVSWSNSKSNDRFNGRNGRIRGLREHSKYLIRARRISGFCLRPISFLVHFWRL